MKKFLGAIGMIDDRRFGFWNMEDKIKCQKIMSGM